MNKSFLVILVLCNFFGYAQKEIDLFSLLPSSQTNIDFINTVEDVKEHNIFIYSNYYGGAGVGIGDFNNDGLQDLFFAGNLVGDQLYLNKGELKFEDVTKDAGIQDNGGWSSGVVIGDVNNDGWQDIYVTRELYDKSPELRKNKLYINTTKDSKGSVPTFKESSELYNLDNSERTRHATFLDYNRDGYLDLLLLNQPPNPGNFSDLYYEDLKQDKFSPRLYKNNGDETFSDITEKAGMLKAGFANSVSIFDGNDDGYQDIYISNDYDTADLFYLNNSDGTFTNIIDDALSHISYFSMGTDAADINNDGKLDLMVVDMVAEDNYRIKSNMSGMNPKSFWKIVSEGGHYQYMFNTMQLNHGIQDNIPQFGDVAQMAGISSTDWSWSNVIADFDNDGYKDVFVTNGLLRDIRNTDSDKEVSNYVTKIADDYVKNNPNGGTVTIWDILDLDEALSLIPSVKIANYAYKNIDGLKFSKVSETWGLDQKTFSSGCAYGDLDNDGDLDLVVNNVNDLASIYRNNSDKDKSHSYLRVELFDQKNISLLGARVQIIQGDTEQLYEFTSVRGMYSTSEQVAHFGLSNDKKVDVLTVTWPNQEKTILKNIKPNQLLTIKKDKSKKQINKEGNPANRLFSETNLFDHEHIENMFNDFEKQVLLPHKQSQFGPSLATGDINGDGLDDVFVGASTGNSPAMYFQKKDGSFSKIRNDSFILDSKYEDIDAVFMDVDNDGDLDLYVVSGGNEWESNSENYQDRLYLNDGMGDLIYTKKNLPKMKESGACVRPYDYDNDGDLDLFIGGRHSPWNYPGPTNSRILENKNGVFTDVTKTIAKSLLNIGMVTDAVWMDYNNDGATDIVLSGEWMPITFIKNNNGKFEKDTEQRGLSNSEGWWYSLEAADMDNDGDLDLVAGNLGMNYKYKATVEEPFEVHYDDFDQNGLKDIVLSYYNFGEQFPLRGKSCSTQQIPTIGEDIKTYNLFASSSLIDVYGKSNLESALHYQAKTFETVYIENKGNGEFNATPLPNDAQISNVDDILLSDFNKDGNKDIIIAGNMYPVEIETTRNDASVGLFLEGDGQGNFTVIEPDESGFMIKGDVQKLSLIESEGIRIIVGALNNGKIKSFSVKAGIE